MRKFLSMVIAIALVGAPAASADSAKSKDRLENCGMVMEEILNIPENIPSTLIDKAECVIVIPSVLKAAFIVGGSYGRGAMTCRSGEHFNGKWSSPTMIAPSASTLTTDGQSGVPYGPGIHFGRPSRLS